MSRDRKNIQKLPFVSEILGSSAFIFNPRIIKHSHDIASNIADISA